MLVIAVMDRVYDGQYGEIVGNKIVKLAEPVQKSVCL